MVLDISQAKSIPENGAWFAPGMVVLVDGVYEGEDHIRGSTLGNVGGVGGTIGGRFVAISIAGPPCERREVTLGISKGNPQADIGTSGGFGWVDFLGVGSERVEGSRMRRIQQNYLRNENEQEGKGGRRIVILLGEVNLDNAKSFAASVKSGPSGTTKRKTVAIVVSAESLMDDPTDGHGSFRSENAVCVISGL